eukprot:NODE_2657_length_1125_cov_29.278557_g2535_i0.p1 GENE.NODE_2657_length_1125_cov_29.278557_g2535_i0~~NODE_2657_length_1125_cov_29.278557_g2535_i0.p1  ORF type:complete len:323 (+),score=74.38 NODE_2657_length_1125_cov_29.278557_g2535_i0:48-971(+)
MLVRLLRTCIRFLLSAHALIRLPSRFSTLLRTHLPKLWNFTLHCTQRSLLLVLKILFFVCALCTLLTAVSWSAVTWTVCIAWLSTPPTHSVTKQFGVHLDYRLPLPSYTIPTLLYPAEYTLRLTLELPEVPANRETMICVTLVGASSERCQLNDTRCIALEYRSPLFDAQWGLYHALPLIWGWKKLAQTHHLTFRRSWTPSETVRHLTVTLASPHHIVAASSLTVERQLRWAPYYFYYYPKTMFLLVWTCTFLTQLGCLLCLVIFYLLYTHTAPPVLLTRLEEGFDAVAEPLIEEEFGHVDTVSDTE